MDNTNITIKPKEISPGLFSTGGTATIPTNSPAFNVITSESLTTQPKIDLTGTNQAPTNTGAEIISSATTSSNAFDTNAEYKRQLELQKQTTPDQTVLNDALKSLGIAEQGLGGAGAEQLKIEEQLGLPEAQKKRASIQGELKTKLAEYEALKTEFEKMSADIEAGAGKKGLTTGAVMGQQGAVDRAKLARLNSKASEIGLIQAQDLALAGEIEAAQKAADRAVDLKYQDREAEYKIKLAQYNRIKDTLTAEESRRGKALEEALKKEAKFLEEQKATEKTIETLKIEAYKNGFRGNLEGVKTTDEALQKIGGFLMSPKEKLEIEKLKGDIAKNAADLIIARGIIGGTTGDPIMDIITASAKYGDKRLTDSQLEKIQKAQSALGTMESLQSLMSQGKDGLKLSGPLTGRVRTLFTQFGGDSNAAAINATIQGLIPTIARGVFGEVGVLTDADIENYRKTVPNLNSSEEQNKFISLVMYDVLGRSLENTLVSNAQNQTNVSNFVSTYKDTKNRINTLKANLGVVESVPESPTTKAYLDNKVGTNLVENINNSLTDYASQFTR